MESKDQLLETFLQKGLLKLNIESVGLSVEEIPISLKPVWFASKL